MINRLKNGLLLGIFFVALAAIAIPSEAQLASPVAKAGCKFADGKTITVNYSSPRMRGRKIFGDLVPFGEVWRAGADDATTFVPNADVTVGGKNVLASSAPARQTSPNGTRSPKILRPRMRGLE